MGPVSHKTDEKADSSASSHSSHSSHSVDGFSLPFLPPLDEVDGAARVLDPIFRALNENELSYGVFFKHYQPTEW